MEADGVWHGDRVYVGRKEGESEEVGLWVEAGWAVGLYPVDLKRQKQNVFYLHSFIFVFFKTSERFKSVSGEFTVFWPLHLLFWHRKCILFLAEC